MKKFLLSLAAGLIGMGAMSAATVTDVLTPESIGLDGKTSYADYTYVGKSGAQYSMQCANGNESIQLRSQSPAGIVVTNSPGTVTKVVIEWHSSTSSTGNRTLDVYGSSTAYTGSAQLYGADSGTKEGGITCGSQTELTFATPAPYIGLRSNNGAMYITSISITWETNEIVDPDPEEPDQPGGDVTVVETITAANFEKLSTTYAENIYTSTETGITYNAFAYKGSGDPATIQIRTNSNNSGVVVTDNPNGYKVVSVEVDQTSASQIDVYGNTSAYTNPADLFGTTNLGTKEGSILETTGSITFTGDEQYWGLRSSNGARYINSIKITYSKSSSDTPSTPVEYDAPFANQTYNMTVGETITLDRGSKYPSQMLMSESGDNNILDIDDEKFTITAKEAGTTEVEVLWLSDDNFTEGYTTFTVNVSEATQPGGTATAAFYATTTYTGDAEYSTQIVNGAGGNLVIPAETFTAGNIEIYWEKKNSSASNVNSNQVRWYQSDILHITPSNGAVIKNIVINEVASYNKNATPSTGSTSISGNNLTWTGETNEELTLTADAQIRFTLMTITYELGEAPAVAAPKITCEDNTVTITCETEGASIYYTVNGDEPSDESNEYTVPFPITENTTVKAIAYKDGEKSSVTTYEAKYIGLYPGFAEFVAEGEGTEGTIEGPITAVYQNGQYLYVVDSKDYPMLVYGNVNQSVVNGNAFESVSGKYSPYNGLPELTNPTLGTLTSGNAVEPTVITLSEMTADLVNTYVTINDVTLSEDLKISDSTDEGVLYKRFNDVTIPTDYSSHYNVTGFVSIYNNTIQLYPTEFEAITVENQVDAPYFTPAAGAVAIGTMIAIECDTEGAVIYYTIDGTEPTTESKGYSEPFEINEAMTVKAIATKEGMINSSIAVAEYTVYDPNAKEGNFDFEDPTNLNPAIEPSTVVSTGIDIDGKTFTSNAVSLEIGESEAANKPRIWTTTSYATEMRVYKGDSFTVIVDNDVYHITSIDFSKASGNFDMEPSSGSLKISGNSATWTPTATEGVSLLSDENISSVTFNITDKTYIRTITVHYAEGSGITTGVDEIAVDDADAVYFNLQGVQVKNPAHGIYIKVVGNKATKVVL